jgi:hypothetical protein
MLVRFFLKNSIVYRGACFFYPDEAKGRLEVIVNEGREKDEARVTVWVGPEIVSTATSYVSPKGFHRYPICLPDSSRQDAMFSGFQVQVADQGRTGSLICKRFEMDGWVFEAKDNRVFVAYHELELDLRTSDAKPETSRYDRF